MQKEGKCPFGEGCSFFHDDEEKRNLIDPLPNLPEGVTLPPMPEKIRNQNKGGRYNNSYSGNKNNNWSGDQNNQNGSSVSPFQFSPLNQQQPPPSLIQITSFAEMAAFGGFNPNKYLSPAPVNIQSQIQQIQFGNQPQMFVAPQMQNMMPMMNNQPQMQGQGKQHGCNNNRSPKGKNTQHRYEKKDNAAQKSGKKGEKNTEQKKYTPKQKKNTSAPKTEASEQPAPVKVADIGASQ